MHGLRPDFAAECVIGEALDLLRDTVGVARLDGLDDPRMQRTPAFMEHAAIRDLVGETVPEGVLDLGEKSGFVEKLRRLQVREPLLQRVFPLVRDRLQQRHRHVHANDGRSLKEVLFQWQQAVNARCENGLHGCGNLDAREGLAIR